MHKANLRAELHFYARVHLIYPHALAVTCEPLWPDHPLVILSYLQSSTRLNVGIHYVKQWEGLPWSYYVSFLICKTGSLS